MKRCKNISCWTDYPILELGDIPNQKAPYRRVIVRSYDGDKYCIVVKSPVVWSEELSIDRIEVQIKTGYLYSGLLKTKDKYGMLWNKLVNKRKFERMINSNG